MFTPNERHVEVNVMELHMFVFNKLVKVFNVILSIH